MAAETTAIVCNFIGDFEVADNIVRNADALCALDATNSQGVFNKLIVIQAASLVEVCLAQIIYRAQNFNREGVPNISEEDRKSIAGTNVEKLNNIIQCMEKYGVLKGMGDGIYAELHKLRKYRNKIHIEDNLDIPDAPRREDAAFSTEIVDWALKTTVTIVNYLNANCARPKTLEQYARTVTLPVR